MIAVLGATGRIGAHVAAGLADEPVDAVALVRQPGAARVPLPTVYADLADPPSLRAALSGATRLFLVTPHGPDQDLLEAVAIDAAGRCRRPQYVVKVSGGAASLGPQGVTTTAIAHWRSEQRVETSGMGFTFLRPSFFQQNLLPQVAPLLAKLGVLLAPFGHAPIAMVDARDIAACAVAALLDPAPASAAWQLTGPRGVTFDDVAAHLGVRYVAISPKAAGRALARQGVSPPEVDRAARMAVYFTAGADGVPTDHVRLLTGRPPRPVEALLDEHRDRFRPATPVARALSNTTRHIKEHR